MPEKFRDTDAPKQRTTNRKRTQSESTHNKPPSKPDGVSDEVWEDWLKYKKKKSKTEVNQYMVDEMVSEAEKAKIPVEEFLRLHMASGWIGYKAEWIKKTRQGVLTPSGTGTRQPSTRRSTEKRQCERDYNAQL